jgi:hypothetical protein
MHRPAGGPVNYALRRFWAPLLALSPPLSQCPFPPSGVLCNAVGGRRYLLDAVHG